LAAMARGKIRHQGVSVAGQSTVEDGYLALIGKEDQSCA
jgi:hypothetical protein